MLKRIVHAGVGFGVAGFVYVSFLAGPVLLVALCGTLILIASGG